MHAHKLHRHHTTQHLVLPTKVQNHQQYCNPSRKGNRWVPLCFWASLCSHFYSAPSQQHLLLHLPLHHFITHLTLIFRPCFASSNTSLAQPETWLHGEVILHNTAVGPVSHVTRGTYLVSSPLISIQTTSMVRYHLVLATSLF